MNGVLIGIGSEPGGENGLNEGMGEARSRQRFIGVLSSILVMGDLVVPVEQVICVGVVAFALAGFAAILVFMIREARIVLDGV